MDYFSIKKKWFLDALVNTLSFSITCYVSTAYDFTMSMYSYNTMPFSINLEVDEPPIKLTGSAYNLYTTDISIQDSIEVGSVDVVFRAVAEHYLPMLPETTIYAYSYELSTINVYDLTTIVFDPDVIEVGEINMLAGSSFIRCLNPMNASFSDIITIGSYKLTGNFDLNYVAYMDFEIDLLVNTDVSADIAGFEFLNTLEIGLNTVYVGEFEVSSNMSLYTYRLFRDLNGLIFSDLSGLIFSDLLYNK